MDANSDVEGHNGRQDLGELHSRAGERRAQPRHSSDVDRIGEAEQEARMHARHGRSETTVCRVSSTSRETASYFSTGSCKFLCKIPWANNF